MRQRISIWNKSICLRTTGASLVRRPKRRTNHRRKPSARELRQIFRLETERAIGNDWVIRHRGRSLQLQPGRRHGGLPRSKALVCEWEDGTMEVHYRGEKIGFTELREPRQKSPAPIAPVVRAMVVRKPKPNHPWRQDLSAPEATGSRHTARWPAHFRFALTAGLRSSAQANENIYPKRGHF